MRLRVLCGEQSNSPQFYQRQNPRLLQFLVQKESSHLCPAGVDFDLHLAIGLHIIRGEALHIATVHMRRIENPLTAHLVLDAQVHQQLVEARGGEAIVLRYLGDGYRLLTAEDGACIVREGFLIGADILQLGISAF